MEHGLILLIEAILAADRNLQKPLAKHLPDLDALRADPRAYFATQEVVIGPRRALVVATVLGLLAGAVVLIVAVATRADRPKAKPVEVDDVLIGFLAVAVTAAFSTALLLRWLRGGAAVLGAAGVQLLYRGRTVFCPWSVFQAPGTPYKPDHNSVLLPIDEHVPVAVARRGGEVEAMPAGELRGKPLAAHDDAQATLFDIYEVRAADLGELLLHVGSVLGDGPAAAVSAAAVPRVRGPLATDEGGGWLRIRLTQLPFPRVCAGCGAPTPGLIELPLGTSKGHAIAVPLCPPCQTDRERRRLKAFFWGFAVGLAPTLLVVALGWPVVGGRALLGLLFALPLGVVAGAVVGLILRDRANPVRFRRYNASGGTVQLRLRDGAGGAGFARALGVGGIA